MNFRGSMSSGLCFPSLYRVVFKLAVERARQQRMLVGLSRLTLLAQLLSGGKASLFSHSQQHCGIESHQLTMVLALPVSTHHCFWLGVMLLGHIPPKAGAQWENEDILIAEGEMELN